MINRRTFTLFSMCTAVGVSGLANAQADKKPKILVVYFSKTNHTKNIADTIARLTGADELRVEVVKPYPEAYRSTTEVVKCGRSLLPLSNASKSSLVCIVPPPPSVL